MDVIGCSRRQVARVANHKNNAPTMSLVGEARCSGADLRASWWREAPRALRSEGSR